MNQWQTGSGEAPLSVMLAVRRFYCPVALVAILCLLAVSQAFGYVAQSSTTAGVQYVSARGVDSNNGLSWNKAKKTIPAAEKSCPASGPCTIHISSLILSLPVMFNRSDTTIECSSGSTISTAVMDGSPITLAANNLRITGCTFEFSSGVGSTVVAIPRSLSHVTIDHNVFRNYVGLPSYFGIIHVGNRTNRNAKTAVTDLLITDNHFLNVAPDAINLQDDVFRATISNNVIATDVSRSNSPTINAQTADPGTSLEAISISNNSISKGTSNNCIQIQNLAFKNTAIQNVTISGNTCSLLPHAGGGAGATGYSLVGIVELKETGNVFEGNGQTIGGNAPFELASCEGVTSSRNVARMGTVIRNVNAFTIIGTRFAVTKNVTLTGNSVSMVVHGSAPATCYHVSAGQGARIEQLVLTGNSCMLSGSATSGILRGIWFQPYGGGAQIQGGTVSQNVIIGASGAHVVGIHFEKGAGTISGVRVERNHFTRTSQNVIGGIGGSLR